jgi:hypothetical protein
VKLLKRGNKGEVDSPPAVGAEGGGESSPAAAAAVQATDAAAPVEPAAVDQPAASYEPPPHTMPATNGGSSRGAPSGLLGRLDPGEQTADERERQAAQDWEQILAPAMDLMRAAVPEANTPEDAARILSQNQGEITPDPEGGAYVRGDAFESDARVYYRLLRRDYEKNPRPSQKREVSHHLHGVYGKLTGTKGW